MRPFDTAEQGSVRRKLVFQKRKIDGKHRESNSHGEQTGLKSGEVVRARHPEEEICKAPQKDNARDGDKH